MTSVPLLEARVSEVGAHVERALLCELAIDDALVGKDVRWISTGAGSSEGPARLFATLLRARGVVADYAPISSFVATLPRADGCVVVSQRLSPNARFPLSRAGAYKKMIVVTTMDEAAAKDAARADVCVVRHGPRDEDGLLLRVIGPAAANATIVRLAEKIAPHASDDRNGSGSPAHVAKMLATSRDRALAALAEARADATALFDVRAIVATGADVALAEGLEHKLLEGLGQTAPTLDLYALVHGPLQSFYERNATLIVLTRENRFEHASRLASVLHPERHRVIRLSSTLAGPLALFDFDHQLNHLVLEALRAHPRDLAEWPGKGLDAALYDLGPTR